MDKKSTVERVLDRLTSVGGRVISLFSGILAAFLILYSGYVLYDNIYTQNQAFSSAWDLLDYRPEIIDDGAVPLTGGDTLASINEDYRAWLTVYNTHIDYPIMQGPNDLYYASHDIHKKSSLTGAIYLATANSPDFSDNYNLVYGHHMDNSAMFGELDLYEGTDYFNSHREAIVVLPDAVYDVTIFAALKTDAYEKMVYTAGNRDLAELLGFIEQNAVQYDAAAARGGTKILALSTCAGAETNGRFVVFGVMTERNMPGPTPTITPGPTVTPGPTPGPTIIPPDPVVPTGIPDVPDVPDVTVSPIGPGIIETPEPFNPDIDNPQESGDGNLEEPAEEELEDEETPLARFINRFQPEGGTYGTRAWALINLIALIITVYLCLPLLHLVAKFGRGKMMKDVNEEKEGLQNAQGLLPEQLLEKARIESVALQNRNGADAAAPLTEDEFGAAVETLYYQQKKFTRKFWIGLILEILISIGAIIAFILTEDIRLPMILIDRWTPLMLLLLFACWLVDLLLVRYRREVEAAEEEQETPEA